MLAYHAYLSMIILKNKFLYLHYLFAYTGFFLRFVITGTISQVKGTK